MTYDYSEIVPYLLHWYERNARILRWREEPRPYYVWVSEIMLQQTRVEAVKGYFDRFLAELPDIRALAEAEEEKLLKKLEEWPFSGREYVVCCDERGENISSGEFSKFQ